VTNLNVDIEHRAKRGDLRVKLRNAIIRVAGLYAGKFKQTLFDLSTALEHQGTTDYSRLPIKPGGFKVLDHERAGFGYKLKQLCLLRVVSMSVMYYWLFCDTHDQQDYDSCVHYLEWLKVYEPQHFNVYGKINRGWYLADKREAQPGVSPTEPEWIIEGTTV